MERLLGLVFNLIALVSDSVWGLVASAARDWFALPQVLGFARTGGTPSPGGSAQSAEWAGSP